MQRVILATTKPLAYGDELLKKSASSLRKVASRKSLPLVLEHDGPKVGTVTDLAYEVRDGIGYLLGSISGFMGKMGLSLQYSGTRSGSEIKVTGVDHAALVDAPRDPISVFSDSDSKVMRYRDSANDGPKESESSEGDPEDSEPQDEEPVTNAGTEIELTDEVVNQLFDLLLKDPSRLSTLKTLMVEDNSEGGKSEDQVTKETVPESKPTRIIIKPREAKESVAKKPPTPIQRPFKGLL